MTPLETTRHFIGEAEEAILHEMRVLRRAQRMQHAHVEPDKVPKLTPGQRVADLVAATIGSWRFIIIQTSILVTWIVLNVTAYVR